jgi:hypothetical protein
VSEGSVDFDWALKLKALWELAGAPGALGALGDSSPQAAMNAARRMGETTMIQIRDI